MSDSTGTNSTKWLLFVALGLFVAVTMGLDTDSSIDVYGHAINPWVVYCGLYLVGVLAGWASRSRR
ncbi:hypothetical protein [Demequina pelophila]|uniref:hypothetical protein n=1 Tax=Demequina pelophila TaxID=1638984 RepID=UPI0007858236|nr:hypothetical protein [Demequina pelophila]